MSYCIERGGSHPRAVDNGYHLIEDVHRILELEDSLALLRIVLYVVMMPLVIVLHERLH